MATARYIRFSRAWLRMQHLLVVGALLTQIVLGATSVALAKTRGVQSAAAPQRVASAAATPGAVEQAGDAATAVNQGATGPAQTMWHLPLVFGQEMAVEAGALTLQATPRLGVAPLTVTMQAEAAGVGVGANQPYDLRWDFGDGASASGDRADHRFTTPGVYTVTLSASNQEGEQWLTQRVTVYDPAQVTVGQVDETGGRVLAR